MTPQVIVILYVCVIGKNRIGICTCFIVKLQIMLQVLLILSINISACYFFDLMSKSCF